MQGCFNPKHSGIRKMYKRILPITENTNLRSYTYYSYVDAIIANELRIGKEAAKIRISGQDQKTWMYLSDSMDKKQSSEETIFLTNKYCIFFI